MKADPLPVFANHVRTRRKTLKLTQETAADRAEMNTSYWSRIERGAIEPGIRMVTRVARALETTPAELLADVNPDSSDASSDRRAPRSPGGPAHNRPRTLASSSPLATSPSPSTTVIHGSAVVYFPTNYSTSRAPARPTPTHPALPPTNLIAVLLLPTTPPVLPFVPPTT
jgi:XRE family transcriptional regulator, regulator of sulfur utilization